MTIDASERRHCGRMVHCRICPRSENIVLNKSSKRRPGSNGLCSFFGVFFFSSSYFTLLYTCENRLYSLFRVGFVCVCVCVCVCVSET